MPARHQPRFRPLAAASILTLAALALTGCAGSSASAGTPAAEDGLVFAMPPSPEDTDITNSAGAIKDIITAATGLSVSQEMPADYLGVVESVRQGHVDVALMSPFSTALAVANDAVDPLVVWEAEAEKPASFCYSRPDSGINEVADIRGKQVAFVDPGSATGYFMPKSMITEAGLLDGTDYKSTFAGGHDSALLALVNGSVDVACSSIAERLFAAGVVKETDIQQMAATDPLPIGVGIVVSKSLDPAIRAKLIESLPEKMSTDPALKDFGVGTKYTVNPGAEAYAPLLKVAENVGVELGDMR